jgi:two-component SAPR family response regulator
MKIEEYRSMIGLMTRKQIKDELEKMRQAQWENECIDRWAAEDRKYAQELYAKTQIARGELEDRDMRDAQESAKREQQIEQAGGNDHE